MPTKTFLNLPEKKRAQIEAAAIHEFAQNGLRGASVNALVETSGIAKGSYYQYFSGMQDVFKHILSIARQKKLALANDLSSSNGRDMFAYLRWLFQVEILFELREPELSTIEHYAFLESLNSSAEADENAPLIGGPSFFNEFLAQGILADDVATWVDTKLAAHLLGAVYHLIARQLIVRLGDTAQALRTGKADIRDDPLAQSLLDNLMDLLEAGLAREPAIRKDFYSK